MSNTAPSRADPVVVFPLAGGAHHKKPHSPTHPPTFLRYSYFKIGKSKIMVTDEVKSPGHTISPASMRFIFFLFHVMSISPTIPMIWPRVCLTAKKVIKIFVLKKSIQQNFSRLRWEAWLGYMTTKYYSDWMTNSQLLAGQKQDLDLRCNMSAKNFFHLCLKGIFSTVYRGSWKFNPSPNAVQGQWQNQTKNDFSLGYLGWLNNEIPQNITKATWKIKILKNKSNDRDSNFLVMFSSSKA